MRNPPAVPAADMPAARLLALAMAAQADRDQCIDQIYRHATIYPSRDGDYLLEIREDAAAIAAAIPLPHPRLRENCSICPYSRICHTPEEATDEYANARSLVTVH